MNIDNLKEGKFMSFETIVKDIPICVDVVIADNSIIYLRYNAKDMNIYGMYGVPKLLGDFPIDEEHTKIYVHSDTFENLDLSLDVFQEIMQNLT